MKQRLLALAFAGIVALIPLRALAQGGQNPAPVTASCWNAATNQWTPCQLIGGSVVANVWTNDIKATTSIASATALSALVANSPTYCVLQAINGTAYGTYDGSTPSSSNYDLTLPALTTYTIQGASNIALLKLQGTNLAGNCWK